MYLFGQVLQERGLALKTSQLFPDIPWRPDELADPAIIVRVRDQIRRRSFYSCALIALPVETDFDRLPWALGLAENGFELIGAPEAWDIWRDFGQVLDHGYHPDFAHLFRYGEVALFPTELAPTDRGLAITTHMPAGVDGLRPK